VDRASLEIFGADGLVALPIGVILPDDDLTLRLYAEGGVATVQSLDIYALDSVWA
jgi:sucrose-6-phosphate hydrolase SacC (GH32 family)